MKTLITIFCLLFSVTAFSQNYVGEWYQHQKQGTVSTLQTNVITLNPKQLKSIMRKKPQLLDLKVPHGDKTYTLNLARVDITADGFKVKTDKGRCRKNTGVQYRGIVDGNPAHIASLNLTTTDKSGFFSTDDGNFTLSEFKSEFIVLNQEESDMPVIDFCETADAPTSTAIQPLVVGSCKVVKVYFECDYAFYQAKGSNLTNITNYVVGLFNQTATIYANEGITIQTSNIFVWTTPDPYAAMSSSATLTAFQNNRGTTFNGDLAHFLSTRSPLGGIAYVDVICAKSYAYGVSRISATYNNFPTYSWSVNVLTHELGHNLGSPHTHSCSWPGGAIDNCYTTEGGCARGPAPVNGGTIMSYCHMVSYGVNFNNGFGTLPGNLIRSRVSNAACLSSTTNGVSPTSLVATNITSTSATLNWSTLPNTTNYTVQYWTTSSTDWTTFTTSTNSLNISGLNPATNYSWKVKGECSSYSAPYNFTTTGSTPTPTTCAAPTNLNEINITATSATLRWTPPTNSSKSYLLYKLYGSSGWSVRSNVIGGSVTVNYLRRNRTYQWKVRSTCTNGVTSVYSPIRQFKTLP